MELGTNKPFFFFFKTWAPGVGGPRPWWQPVGHPGASEQHLQGVSLSAWGGGMRACESDL